MGWSAPKRSSRVSRRYSDQYIIGTQVYGRLRHPMPPAPGGRDHAWNRLGRSVPPGVHQGCSVLRLGQAIGEQTVEAEGIGVDRPAYVGDAVGAQDVQRERAVPGEDVGLALDPAGVLAGT